ncbi:outer membrane protein assembly factor [Marinospirillum insulare]|uniref:Translocation and assembly module subunit TamA n=1 Tax=Marinospirillum insulare TaxID=217169 RepID=A0ABQ5ZSA1_9GAMM|nr:outer membrane protein assembly factor [Marinospirillum insulare]
MGLLLFLLLNLFYFPQAAAADKKRSALVLKLEPELAPVRNNIEAYLGTIEERNTDEMRRYARFAREQIAQAVEALGYYQYGLHLEVKPGDPAQLQVNLLLGEPVKLQQVNIKLAGEAAGQANFTLPSTKNLQIGQQLNHAHYEAAKKHFLDQALSYGYFAADFSKNTLTILPEANVANIDLHFNSGPRYRFGEVSFEQQGQFQESFIKKFVRFKKGDAFDAERLSELSRELRASNYFNEVLVDINEDLTTANLEVPVEVLLTRRKPHSLDLGIGYSTDIGPRLSGSWTQHWLNDLGHSRGVNSELSLPRKAVSAWYQLPLSPPMTDKLRFTTSVEDERFDDHKSQRFSAAIQWQHQQANSWDRNLSLKGLQENFQIGEEEDRTWLTLPGITLNRLYTDQRVDPTKGYRLHFNLAASHQEFLSDINIFQVTAFARGLYTFYDNHRFLTRVQMGDLYTEDFSITPVSLRFFAGGDQTIRGYGYQEIAPKSETGRLLGGRYLIVGSTEYQYSLSPTWRLAVFVDAGNVSLERKELQNLKVGRGIGLRWISPVGALRLDVAQGLDELEGGWQLHFSMGPEL